MSISKPMHCRGGGRADCRGPGDAGRSADPDRERATARASCRAAGGASGGPGRGGVGKEVVENRTDSARCGGGDFVTRAVLIILGIMSFGSLVHNITKLYEQFRLNAQARDMQKSFWSAKSVKDGVGGLKDGSAVPLTWPRAVSMRPSTTRGSARADRPELRVTMTVQRAQEKSRTGFRTARFSGDGWLDRPLRGLFGTVWGIYHALTAIGIAGQASIDKVGGPGGRGPDHDRHRPGGRGAGGARVSTAGAAATRSRWKACARFGADLHMVLLGASGKAMTETGRR